MKALVTVSIALIPTAIWWAILTFVAFAITKSGGSGEWVNEYKPYVLIVIYVFSLFSSWVTIQSATKPQFKRRRFR